jgi:hypothetical protein
MAQAAAGTDPEGQARQRRKYQDQPAASPEAWSSREGLFDLGPLPENGLPLHCSASREITQ